MSRFLLALALAACTAGDKGAPDADADGWDASVDCDDGDDTLHPNADETCDGVDQDCDGEVDEAATDAGTWFVDTDGDGYGDASTPLTACDAPDGYVADATDCDDADAAFHPGADEADCADPNDYDCDGSVGHADADGDGYAACDDCDDTDAAVNPAATETCDGVDDDCDGETDEDAVDAVAWYDDTDGDGYGGNAAGVACEAPQGTVANADDCDDDAAPTVNPAAPEICDGRDDDCDGLSDDADDTVEGATDWYVDSDGDGFGEGDAIPACLGPAGTVPDGTDCDDTRADVSPDAAEVCDGVDDDCDGRVDDADDVDTSSLVTWSLDRDGDGYGGDSGRFTYTSCEAPAGYVADASDCDDADAAISPAATEVCDAADVDEDCDGLADDADASVDPYVSGGALWYADRDGDGYGDASDAGMYCDAPAGRSLDATDCDDSSAAAHPGGTEVCDDLDDDCDGVVDWGHRVPTDYADVQSAIDASDDGDTVCVEAGTYTGMVDFDANDIQLVGTYGSALTTLDGGGAGAVVSIDEGEVATVSGFTITGGSSDEGAGVYAIGATLTLTDLVITGNTCAAYECTGVGLYVDGGTVVLDDVDVHGNVATADDQAFSAGACFEDAEVAITDSAFDDNTATAGASAYGVGLAMYDVTATVTDVTVDGNGASAEDEVWGAVDVEEATVDFTRVTVTDNTATSPTYVGTAAVFEGWTENTWADLVVSGNTATAPLVDAVGFYSYTSSSSVTNAIVAGNTATADAVWGAAGMVLWNGGATVTNATVVGNTLVTAGDGAMSVGLLVGDGDNTLTNVAVTGNTVSGGGTAEAGGVWFDEGVSVRYCDSYGNDVADWSSDLTGADGNVSVDPMYTDTSASDPLAWDVTLRAGSPLVDAGDPSVLDPDGSTSDIGAWGGPGASDW